MTRDIEIQERDVRDAETVQKPPKVIDVPPSERHDRDGRVIGEDASSFK